MEKKNFQFSEKQIIFIINHIAIAIYELHNKNIIHRDIKPENIMIRCENQEFF